MACVGLVLWSGCGGGGAGANGGKFSCDYSSPHTCVDYVGFNAVQSAAVQSTCKNYQGATPGTGCNLADAVAGCRITTPQSDGTTATLTTWYYDGTAEMVSQQCDANATLVQPGAGGASGTSGSGGAGGFGGAGGGGGQGGALGATSLTAGGSHACASLSDGSVKCWGTGIFGALGDDSPVGCGASADGCPAALTPVAVTGLTGVTAIAAGDQHTCARLSDGSARCWGWDNEGQLGDGTQVSSAVPVAVKSATTVSKIFAGLFRSCAILTSGSVQCWGESPLGDGTDNISNLPVTATSVTGATSLSVGGRATCALLTGGAVQCWGDLAAADGTITEFLSPMAIDNLGAVTAIALSSPTDPCVLLASGAVSCGGAFSTLAGVSGLGGATALVTDPEYSDMGNTHVCALLADTSVVCWGDNSFGELGDGTTTNSAAPVPVKGLTGAIAVATGNGTSGGGGAFSCALLMGGSVKCWGSNGGGALGNGTTKDSPIPVPVSL